jgi:methylated-DNA-[protein]-cysteine S-methyltransferase
VVKKGECMSMRKKWQVDFSAIMGTSFGAIGLQIEGSMLKELVYLPSHFKEQLGHDALTKKIVSQLQAYFKNPHALFNVELAEVGTEFQRRVWREIMNIPCGQVRTYGELAKKLRTAPRAVGQACGANWFPLIVPCHRVVGMTGLGGFARDTDTEGFHVGVKRWLLQHEGVLGVA